METTQTSVFGRMGEAPEGWAELVEEATRRGDSVMLGVSRWSGDREPRVTLWSTRLGTESKRARDAEEPDPRWGGGHLPVPGGDDPLGDVLMIYRAFLGELDALERARAERVEVVAAAYGLDAPATEAP